MPPLFDNHSPTLPGCFSNGKTIEEARRNIRVAVEQHVAVLAEHRQMGIARAETQRR